MTLLALKHVSKSFGRTVALRDVSFDLMAGEVHVVAGENGAGKSTLIRIIAGADTDFSGELVLGGQPLAVRDPRAARAAGIATIHQELSLVSSLSIADNLVLSTPGAALSRVDRRRARERALGALTRVGLQLEPERLVETLPLAERQLVEIARALAAQVRVLVMDEPTSALAAPDVERLLAMVEDLARSGIGIVYVSHRLDEIFRVADRISVLRDGARVLTANATELDRPGLLRAMLGREVEVHKHAGKSPEKPVRLRVHALESPTPSALQPVSFELGRGELLGLAGVEGSGASTLLHALFGDGEQVRADIELDGERYQPRDPAHALASGLALLASDRQKSVLPLLSVLENATLSSLPRFSPGGRLRPERERRAVAPESERVRLKAASLDAAASELSGGNQQKVALLRCLLTQPRVLLFDDPTRGIDLGARADVHELLRGLAAAGTSVLFRSSDLSELVELADRVLVLFDGKKVATLERDELSEPRLLSLMMGEGA